MLGDLSSVLAKDLREYCRNESGQERHSVEAPEIYFDLHLPKSITTTSGAHHVGGCGTSGCVTPGHRG